MFIAVNIFLRCPPLAFVKCDWRWTKNVSEGDVTKSFHGFLSESHYLGMSLMREKDRRGDRSLFWSGFVSLLFKILIQISVLSN